MHSKRINHRNITNYYLCTLMAAQTHITIHNIHYAPFMYRYPAAYLCTRKPQLYSKNKWQISYTKQLLYFVLRLAPIKIHQHSRTRCKILPAPFSSAHPNKKSPQNHAKTIKTPLFLPEFDIKTPPPHSILTQNSINLL